MTNVAFHGDAAVRQALLDTIDRHTAAGTLVFDGTIWDGTRGSPLGIAIEGDDPTVYAERYGVPLQLAALLDPMMSTIPDPAAAARYARDWVASIAPGKDLTAMPSRLVLHLLDLPEARGVDDALAERIASLHRRDAGGDGPSREEWTALGRELLCCAASVADPRATATMALWEACSWSARRGRSLLTLAFAKWSELRAYSAYGEWTYADAARAQAVLQALWDEQEQARNAGAEIDYPALFQARHTKLAAGFVAHLDRSNTIFLERGVLLADWCINYDV